MVVQHNMPALTANRYYTTNNSSLSKSLEKLSSGYAINRAGDNAAGLAVSEKMRAQIAGLTQASKNAEDGISMVQTYEGALQETDSILQRMRTIAVQSANGSYQNDVDRDALQLEFDQLNDELNQIADTDFNGVVVLNGGVMADGTVANDTTKVAERPEVPEIKTSPNAAFTYKSTVNGTVDSGGNGSLSINGVTLKLKDGQGKASLGSVATGGKTTYSTDGALSVSDGKVNGTIKAEEAFAIDDSTSKIEIHGSSYTITKDSSGVKNLVDGNGKSVQQIDGLAVSVSSDAVKLSGNYIVYDSKVTTSRSFSSHDSVDEASGLTNVSDLTVDAANKSVDSEGNTMYASVSATDVSYSTSDSSTDPVTVNEDAAGTVKFNGTSITVLDGESVATTLGNVSGITAQVTEFSADPTEGSNLDKVSGKVTLGGAIDLTGADPTKSKKTTWGEDTVEEGKVNLEVKNTDTATGIAVLSLTDSITGIGTEITIQGGTANGEVKITTQQDTTGKTIDIKTSGDFYLKADGSVTDVEADGAIKISLTANSTIKNGTAAEKAAIADVVNGVKTSHTYVTDDAVGKVYTNGGGTAIVGVGDSKANVERDATTKNATAVNFSNGIKVDGTGSVAATEYTINDKLGYETVGSFKISSGVSTSDTYNHGTANLTFADNMTLQVGARSKDAVTFNFSYTTNGIGNLKADLNASARGLGTDQVSVKNQEDANAAIDAIDNAINKVSMIRGTFGAIQNRLEHKISNINTNAENLTAAESRIRDTQMDQEMMKFTSAQILSQASQSMLAQANSLPQGVLQLLG